MRFVALEGDVGGLDAREGAGDVFQALDALDVVRQDQLRRVQVFAGQQLAHLVEVVLVDVGVGGLDRDHTRLETGQPSHYGQEDRGRTNVRWGAQEG